MKTIFKYLKPYLWIVLTVIALTLVQVQTELSLPDYMSDIVTDGIQYNGIKETMPKIISKEDMELLQLVSDEDFTVFYDLVSKGTSAVVDKEEILFSEDTYLIKEEMIEEKEMTQPMAIVSYLSSALGKEEMENILRDPAQKASMIAQLEADASFEENQSALARTYMKQLYEDAGLNIEKIQSGYILSTGSKMLIVSFISLLAQLISTYLSTKTASRAVMDMRSDVFKKVESFSSEEFSRFTTSSLITRTTDDLTQAQMLMQMMMRMVLMAPMMGITSVFKVLRYPGMTWLLLLAIGIIVACLIILLVFALPKFTVIQALVDKMNNTMREFLDGMLVIRAFNAQKTEEERFDESNKELNSIQLFVNKLTAGMMPVMNIVLNFLTIGIIWFGAKQIDINAMAIGDMMAFIQYAMHVVMSFMFVAVTWVMIPRSLVSVKRVTEVLEAEPSITDKENTIALPKENGELVFENVSFKYPGDGDYVLEDISFSARPKETVAIIGSTGSGKSTIVQLIPRLFDVSRGRITYCGIDLRDLKQEELHERIGYVSQKAILFSGDIRSNIEFGRDLSEEEIREAIRISQSENIIEEKEEGMAAPITQGGTNVSGGQKQRLSIARALSKKADIYIFDDAFSALDFATDKKLRKELSEVIEQTSAIVIIVAQRISTIMNADKIIVLDSGKIVGMGTHKELLKDCEVYQEIASSQLSKEELANA